MFLDASAIVAILAEEPGWQELHARMVHSRTELYSSAVARFEASQAIARLSSGKQKPTMDQLAGARDAVDEFLDGVGAESINLDNAIGSLAIEASMRYGKVVGHPADLNLGDCFAYACAKALKVRLLYQGNDFSQTDLA